MNHSRIHAALLIALLVGATLAAGCGSNLEGKYRDAEGAVTLELKDGKANLNYGGLQLDATYTVDGDKISLRPTGGETAQTMVLTVNKDGSIDGPRGTNITNLKKVN
jgi:hypothetical protein